MRLVSRIASHWIEVAPGILGSGGKLPTALIASRDSYLGRVGCARIQLTKSNPNSVLGPPYKAAPRFTDVQGQLAPEEALISFHPGQDRVLYGPLPAMGSNGTYCRDWPSCPRSQNGTAAPLRWIHPSTAPAPNCIRTLRPPERAHPSEARLAPLPGLRIVRRSLRGPGSLAIAPYPVPFDPHDSWRYAAHAFSGRGAERIGFRRRRRCHLEYGRPSLDGSADRRLPSPVSSTRARRF